MVHYMLMVRPAIFELVVGRSGLYTEFYDLLESKSRHYDDTAEDMINDDISSCG